MRQLDRNRAINMILITTAGKVGAEVARLLAAQGEPVRVLARHPEKVVALSEAGVEVEEGDLEVSASIDAAMRDVSSVILVSLAIPTQELNVVDSAVRAGVEHVVKITSKASAASPIARRRGQTEIEDGLTASGLGHTLLRNNVYMQNFLILAPAIARTNSFGANTGHGRAGLIDTRDVAAVAAEIATNPAPHHGHPGGAHRGYNRRGASHPGQRPKTRRGFPPWIGVHRVEDCLPDRRALMNAEPFGVPSPVIVS
jgi:uncharacterized protein YbjT (DUF2867 family)